MGAGFATVIIWKILGINFDNIVPAMLMNLLFTMASHYILKQQGGWVNTKKIIEEEKQDHLFSKIQNFNLIEFLKANTPDDNKSYTLFGVFCFISTVGTIYLTHDYNMNKHFDILLYIDQSMLVISCFFMFYLMWSPKLKHPLFLSVVWHISLIFMLSFCSSFFLLLSNFGTVQLVIFTLNLMVLFNLSKWKNALGIIFIGFTLSLQVYRQYSGAETIELTLGHSYVDFIYIILLVVTALITFLKPKQEYQEATEAKVGTLETEVADLNERVVYYSERISDQGKEIERLGTTAQKILNNVNHELRLPVGNVMNFAEMLNNGLDKFDKKQLKLLSDEVYKNSNRLSSMIMNMLDLTTLEAKKIELSKSMINFGELVRDRVQICRKMYLGDKKIDFEMRIEGNMFVNIDPNYIRQTVDNLVINAINFSTEGVIRISALRKENFVEFVIEDEGIGIPKEELYDIFTPFKMGSNTQSKAEGRGVGLALCKAAIEAHGGYITAESKSCKGARFRFRIGKRVYIG
jgi:signal transduction histidine kinase